jgi:hypothetical protein
MYSILPFEHAKKKLENRWKDIKEILTSDNFKKRVISRLNYNLDRMIVITFSVGT